METKEILLDKYGLRDLINALLSGRVHELLSVEKLNIHNNTYYKCKIVTFITTEEKN